MTVGGLIFNQENKFFLMTSPKWDGKYTIPGGHIERGETIEEALRREIKEETNLDIFEIEFITYMESLSTEDFHDKRHFIFFDFACQTKTEEVVLDREGTDYVWVTLDEALQLPLANSTKDLILIYRDQQ